MGGANQQTRGVVGGAIDCYDKGARSLQVVLYCKFKNWCVIVFPKISKGGMGPEGVPQPSLNPRATGINAHIWSRKARTAPRVRLPYNAPALIHSFHDDTR